MNVRASECACTRKKIQKKNQQESIPVLRRVRRSGNDDKTLTTQTCSESALSCVRIIQLSCTILISTGTSRQLSRRARATPRLISHALRLTSTHCFSRSASVLGSSLMSFRMM